MKKIQSSAKDGWYEITPNDATRLLETGLKNRTLSPTRTQAIAEDIARGAWVPNGESIVVDPEGRLADGQHRMRAISIAGKPVVSYVVYLPENTKVGFFDTIDSGKARSHSDRLDIDGVVNVIHATALVRQLLYWESGQRSGMAGSKKTTSADVRKRYAKSADSIQAAVSAVYRASGAENTLRGIAPPSIIAFAYFMAREIDADKAERWLAGVTTGENLSPGNPALVFRNRLISSASTPASKLSKKAILIGAVRSWNAFAAGGQIGIMKLALHAGETFPEFFNPDADPD